MIDFESTRISLLSQPPLSREASETFFSKLVDETEAEIFLDQLRESASKSTNNPVLESFLSLPPTEQLSRLTTIGTLRPLYDEYTTEKARVQFVTDHEDFLLRGVPLENLIPDDMGPVMLDSSIMGLDNTAQQNNHKEKGGSGEKTSRFRLDKVPYGDDNAKRQETILEAWGTYKSTKATHEENLFNEGKLGLQYGKDDKDSADDDNDDHHEIVLPVQH